MATTTSLRVSFLFWLLVFYPDCHLEGVQASPTSKTLANAAAERPGDLGRNLENIASSTFNDTLAGLEGAESVTPYVVYRYTGTLYAQSKPTLRTLRVTYNSNYRIQRIRGTTYWKNGVGSSWISSGGVGRNYFALTWRVPARASATFVFYVTVNRQVSNKYLYFMNILIPSRCRMFLETFTVAQLVKKTLCFS
jgi:hypothetical protein